LSYTRPREAFGIWWSEPSTATALTGTNCVN